MVDQSESSAILSNPSGSNSKLDSLNDNEAEFFEAPGSICLSEKNATKILSPNF